MAGHKNLGLRLRVRKFLRSKKNQSLSDRDVAKECGCSRPVVKSVRLEMIAAGLHEPISERTQGGHDPVYKPGAVARGGYVYDADGNTVRIDKWVERQKRDATPPPA
ncbi:hypothetical protein GobsT_31170 [Gemmata obscuriglobus]|uniref:Uncharacterized protein n=1 Tax=Gemmata obscuriglobus TaxID=114 RepID=A0A2Z3HAP7_9BACT|nr:hypothetical protein [Gemmata obscuriglobus]AWM38694.1 hypothetical protein C1280_18005 [Gemmata obscuriglobus]QEG28340.1 hypothetical protein GobsT_31170 [Gemmata obscuriglobus]VTS06217.1 unnamed protein product [Gemmata obscuriglobus UQM 2246]